MIWMLILAVAVALPYPAPFARLGTNDDEPKAPRDGPVDDILVAADLDLFAMALRAGQPFGAAAGAVSVVASNETRDYWRNANSLYAVGLPAGRAFADAGPFAEVARLMKTSERSGAAVARGCEELAADIRDAASDHAKAQAEKAGVLISLPLTLCFLPAFIVLGLAPVVVSLGADILNH